MSQTITIEIPDDLLEDLNKQAGFAGTTPGEFISRNLPRITIDWQAKGRRPSSLQSGP